MFDMHFEKICPCPNCIYKAIKECRNLGWANKINYDPNKKKFGQIPEIQTRKII
jgi:hypothetical protein